MFEWNFPFTTDNSAILLLYDSTERLPISGSEGIKTCDELFSNIVANCKKCLLIY